MRILSRNGLEEIYKFPPASRKLFAPIYTVERYRQESYENKIFGSIAGHTSEKLGMKNMILAQNLWDATMTDSILKTIEKKRTKVIHINGRFHSDEYMGVTHRLKEFGLRVLTISMFVHRSLESPNQTQLKNTQILFILREQISQTKKKENKMFQYKHRHLEIASIFLFVVYCIMLLVKIGEETIRLANNLGYLVIPLALAPLFVGYVGADFFPGLFIF